MYTKKKLLWILFESIYLIIGLIIIDQIIQFFYPVPWGDISLKDIYFMLPFGILIFFIIASLMMIIFKEKYRIPENCAVYYLYKWIKKHINI